MNFLKGFRTLVFLLLSITFLACTDFDKSQLDNLSNGKVLKIGHAGSGFRRWLPFNAQPANSMTSIKNAIEAGADGIEVDLQMTKDGKFVLYHDNRLESMTQDTGCIPNRNWNEISNLKYHLGFPFQWFQNESLISLDSLVSYFKSFENFPNLQIDMRSSTVCYGGQGNLDYLEQYSSMLVKTLIAHKVPKDKVLLISTDIKVFYYLEEIKSPFPFSIEVTDRPQYYLDWAVKHNVEYLTVKTKFLSKAYSRQIHEKGKKVITFGAKSKSGNRKLLELNPDVLQTDNMEALVELLD